ncbi:MAG: response regulator transcription factor [Alphaproteobacteria bacterium]|nr:response regulator transcription factor [Alphaproteobacteria bacterium]
MNKTILIIDDDDVLRASLAKGLRANGFDAVTARSAEIGEQILERISADAIVLDRMMEGMDGLSFLRRLRAGGDRTPVIMLTALSGPENAIAGLSGGADDYLAKPFQLKELVLRLHNIMKSAAANMPNLPHGLAFSDNEFYIKGNLLGLSAAEKELLKALVSPVGNTAGAAPMVAKRLRDKLNAVLSAADLITVRGKGYKLAIIN